MNSQVVIDFSFNRDEIGSIRELKRWNFSGIHLAKVDVS